MAEALARLVDAIARLAAQGWAYLAGRRGEQLRQRNQEDENAEKAEQARRDVRRRSADANRERLREWSDE